MATFGDRDEAGRTLASALLRYAARDDVLVLALPRGGVPVGAAVARVLRVPLDVFTVRKLGVPHQRELAMGAIATGGVRFMNDAVVEAAGVSPVEIEAVAAREAAELARRERAYRGDRPPRAVSGRTVILVDDGLATGASMRAAVLALRRVAPARIVVAVPVGAAEACGELREHADEVVCLATPEPFRAVGVWYRDFAEVDDAAVRALLRAAAVASTAPAGR